MKIGIIGCGNMGSGFALRLAAEHDLSLCDKDNAWVEELARAIKAKPCSDIAETVRTSEVIILAVKPQNLLTVAKQIKPEMKPNKLLISILAGTSLSLLKQQIGHFPIVRMMPNLAAIYGKGIIAVVESSELQPKFKKVVEKIVQPLGPLHWVPEDKIDAITSLTASGPAFAFVMIEAMVEAAIAMGFQSKEALNYVLEMLTGTITIINETGQHPAELKWQVTSPAGTTSAGLRKMEEEGVRAGITNAFLAAYQRAQQMSAEK